MTNNRKILIVNPGSTSTKIGVFAAGEIVVNESARHNDVELSICSGGQVCRDGTIWPAGLVAQQCE